MTNSHQFRVNTQNFWSCHTKHNFLFGEGENAMNLIVLCFKEFVNFLIHKFPLSLAVVDHVNLFYPSLQFIVTSLVFQVSDLANHIINFSFISSLILTQMQNNDLKSCKRTRFYSLSLRQKYNLHSQRR